MAVAVVQSKVNTGTTPFVTDGIETVTLDAAATVGNRIYVAIQVSATSRSIASVVDSGSNTYALVAEGGTNATNENSGESIEQWLYAANVGSAATTVTVTLSAAIASEARMTVIEVSGPHATTPDEDVQLATSSATTTHTSGTVTVAGNGSLLIGLLSGGGSGSYTEDADFTNVVNTNSVDGSYVVGWDQVDAGSYTRAVTSVGNETTIMILVGIAPAAAGGGVKPKHLFLMGCG